MNKLWSTIKNQNINNVTFQAERKNGQKEMLKSMKLVKLLNKILYNLLSLNSCTRLRNSSCLIIERQHNAQTNSKTVKY